MRRISYLLAWLLIATVPAFAKGPAAHGARAIDVDNPPQGTFVDDWMEIFLGDAKAGYANSTFTREGDEIISRMLISMSVGREGVAVKVSVATSSHETLDGRVLSFDNTTNMSNFQTSLSGRVKDGRVTVTKSIGNGDAVIPAPPETFDFPTGALMSWGLFRKERELKLVEGTTAEVAIYEPAIKLDEAVKSSLTVGGHERVQVGRKQVEAIRVEQTLATDMGEFKMPSWVDEDWNPLAIEYPFPGIGALRMIRSDRATAMKDFTAPEFFQPTIVRVHKHIDRETARKITYRISVTGKGDDLPPLPATGMQTSSNVEARSAELVVQRQDHAALKSAAKIVPAAELDASVRPFLAPSLYINCDDPAVIAMAKEAADGEQEAYALVDKLRRYVTREIKEKGLDVGFASASEVCRERKGDCSEHAVLLAALARARGIPARVVTGLVYVPTFAGHEDVFGFHMWTQVYLAGQWVDIDAAQRETDCNPTHIALAVLSNKESSMSEAAFALLPVIGRLKIEVLEILNETADER